MTIVVDRSNSVLIGTVSKVSDFGAFLVLDNGEEGLLHITNLADSRIPRVGEHLPLKVLKYDPDKEKMLFTSIDRPATSLEIAALFIRHLENGQEEGSKIQEDLLKIASTPVGRDLLLAIMHLMDQEDLKLSIHQSAGGVESGYMSASLAGGEVGYRKDPSQTLYYTQDGDLVHLEHFTSDQELFHELVHYFDRLQGESYLELCDTRSNDPRNSNWAEESAVYGKWGYNLSKFSENAYLRSLGRPERIFHRGATLEKTPEYTRLQQVAKNHIEELDKYLELPGYSDALDPDLEKKILKSEMGAQVLTRFYKERPQAEYFAFLARSLESSALEFLVKPLREALESAPELHHIFLISAAKNTAHYFLKSYLNTFSPPLNVLSKALEKGLSPMNQLFLQKHLMVQTIQNASYDELKIKLESPEFREVITDDIVFEIQSDLAKVLAILDSGVKIDERALLDIIDSHPDISAAKIEELLEKAALPHLKAPSNALFLGLSALKLHDPEAINSLFRGLDLSNLESLFSKRVLPLSDKSDSEISKYLKVKLIREFLIKTALSEEDKMSLL
ncbi:MAG: S1 RNA-binding domain-containing protein [Simkaniaceae bacterium]|nr:S1 RNA-binding domain-containing protein [Simkaniaceae bacterium]